MCQASAGADLEAQLDFILHLPGERLNEVELLRSPYASRTLLRAALNRLNLEGLLRFAPARESSVRRHARIESIFAKKICNDSVESAVC